MENNHGADLATTWAGLLVNTHYRLEVLNHWQACLCSQVTQASRSHA